MKNLKCPNCGEVFTIDDHDLSSIISQIRNDEFDKDVNSRVNEKIKDIESKYEAELNLKIAEEKLKLNLEFDKKIQNKDASIMMLNTELSNKQTEMELSVLKATSDLEKKMDAQKESYELELRDKQTQLDYYKDLKTKMSTKMVGETLEQHCLIEFNKIRGMLSRNVYFDKDNTVSKTGSKGDFIYREVDDEGNEIISIMFEMKNGATCSTTSHCGEKVAA